MNKDLLKMAGNIILTVVVCCVVNNILRRIGIEWLNAYSLAIGFLLAKIHDQKQTIIKLGERV